MPQYKIDVSTNRMIRVEQDDLELDYFGPWDTIQAARQWAALMLSDLNSGVRHYPEQPEQAQNL